MKGYAVATADDLPKLVGYKQLREIYGWPRSTIQDWITARKFPKAMPDMPGREAVWLLSDILEWLDNRRTGLINVAMTEPDKLKPDDVERVARDLAARHAANVFGEKVAPDDVVIGRRRDRTASEAFGEASGAIELMIRLGHQLDQRSAVVVAAMAFPSLHSIISTIEGGNAAIEAAKLLAQAMAPEGDAPEEIERVANVVRQVAEQKAQGEVWRDKQTVEIVKRRSGG